MIFDFHKLYSSYACRFFSPVVPTILFFGLLGLSIPIPSIFPTYLGSNTVPGIVVANIVAPLLLRSGLAVPALIILSPFNLT